MCRQVADAAEGTGRRLPTPRPALIESLLDPKIDSWIADHRPNWTIPVLPLMSMVDRMAQAAAAYSGQDVVALRDIRLHRWLTVQGCVRLQTKVDSGTSELEVSLLAWRESANSDLSRFELVATATVQIGVPRLPPPEPFDPLRNASLEPDPYRTGALFHGPRFQYLVSLSLSPTGASGVLDPSRGAVPRGLLHQGLLDAALHVIPAQSLWRWIPEIDRGVVAIPHRIAWLELHEPLPDTGEVRVEARFAGFDTDEPSLPVVDLQLSAAGTMLAAFRIIMGLPGLGRLAKASPADRRTFLRDRRYVAGMALATADGETTTLSSAAVHLVDWPSGSIVEIYGLPPEASDRVPVIAVKEHIARKLAVHPSTVAVDENLRTAWIPDLPDEQHHVEVTWEKDTVRVRSSAPPASGAVI
ncbi:hypothetical protein ACIBCN_16300 [Nocardia sp. NPDC051052]|uniref:hypothetical protein n=1 Tax=Nocardia sp. NPDC051052 TaxID=3364322 RepID=UPI0037A0EF53